MKVLRTLKALQKSTISMLLSKAFLSQAELTYHRYIEKYDDEGNVEYIPGDPEVEKENDLLTTPGRSLQEGKV